MIKIVDSGYGVRLSFDETEVFNHTSLVPFIKSVKAEKKFGVKNGKLTARFDVDGEYTLSDVKTKSCSVKSAHIDFSGYDGDFVKKKTVLRCIFQTRRFPPQNSPFSCRRLSR